MSSKAERKTFLRDLLALNGVRMDSTDDSIQRINDWFRACIAEDPHHPGRLMPDWYSLVNDLALYLGDVMIERNPELYWDLFVWGKTSVDFQSHVIMGFGVLVVMEQY
jgi:hypothetical protein